MISPYHVADRYSQDATQDPEIYGFIPRLHSATE